MRSIRLEDNTWNDPEIQQLMEVALQRAKVGIDPGRRRQLIIKSISARQRPRRPGVKKR